MKQLTTSTLRTTSLRSTLLMLASAGVLAQTTAVGGFSTKTDAPVTSTAAPVQLAQPTASFSVRTDATGTGAQVLTRCADPSIFKDLESNMGAAPNAAPNSAQCNLPGVSPSRSHPTGTRLVVEFDRDTLPADGQSAANITIRLLDDFGRVVTGSRSFQQVTLEVERGRWSVPDADPMEPGVQIQLVNGEAVVRLIADHEPGDRKVRFSSGNLSVSGQVAYTPDLRPMIAAGMIEGVLGMRKNHSGLFAPARSNDVFEKELRAFSRETVNGDNSKYSAARASLFLKGTIKGEYLLTIGADSDKDTRTKLYRDIKPDAIYPVYGDSSIRGWEAESKGKLYVKVGKDRSYAMFGDIATQDADPARVLGQYTRNVTGAKWHLEDGKYKINAFVSQDSQRQTVDELPGLGISGPYKLSQANLVAFSDSIDIITRDRNQPSIILKVETRQRGLDYDLDPIGGTILFNIAVPSRDANFNPVSIRAVYEQDAGGKKFLVAGVDAQVRLGERVQVGASTIKSDDPNAPYTLTSINSTVKLTPNTTATVELAKSMQDLITFSSSQQLAGRAGRVEVLHQSNDLSIRAFAVKTGEGFADQARAATNAAGVNTLVTPTVVGTVPDSSNNGRTEASVKAAYRLTPSLALKGELVHSEVAATGASRDGVFAGVGVKLTDKLELDVGVRKSHEHAGQVFTQSPTSAPGTPDIDRTAAVVKVTGKVTNEISVIAEYEKATSNAAGNSDRYGLGAEAKVNEQGVVYIKHEHIDSATGLYGLNSSQSNSNTVLGYRHTYLQDTSVFSEYRMRDAISGVDGATAYGVRHGWNVSPDLKMTAGLESLKCIQGNCSAYPEATAMSIGAAYTGSDTFKLSGKLEKRDAGGAETWLATLGGGMKVTRDLTTLSRATISKSTAADGERTYDNLMMGVAWRETERNQWNALGKVQLIRDINTAVSLAPVNNNRATVFALSGNYQPSRKLVFGSRLAIKLGTDLSGSYTLNLASLRATYDVTD